MKNKLVNFSISTLIVFISGLVVTLVLSLLYISFLFFLKKLKPTFEYSSIYITIARVSLIVLGSVVGVNINRD